MALSQERDTLKVPDVPVIAESLSPIDAKAEIQGILEKTNIDSIQVKQLKKLVNDYAIKSNQYRTMDSLTARHLYELKELETKHKFEIKNLLGEDNYRKLLVVVPMD